MQGAVVGNESEPDVGHVGRRLSERGVSLQPWARERRDHWSGLLDLDVLVLLGSDWSVYWDHVDEAVAAEQELVRQAQVLGVPVLAICFGAQVVASALGGSVERSPRPEIGWLGIDSDERRISAGPWMQWHSDRVVVPPGAVELARSPVAPQAFVTGRILAVQFHPEVTFDTVLRWSSGDGGSEMAAAGVDRDQVLADTHAYAATGAAGCEALVDWFCDDVATRPMVR
ncbi:MAG: putative amino transferase [Acidimicrobiia bacterium]|nr:putative amino transferase [Acidimicrobiia bacterium]